MNELDLEYIESLIQKSEDKLQHYLNEIETIIETVIPDPTHPAIQEIRQCTADIEHEVFQILKQLSLEFERVAS